MRVKQISLRMDELRNFYIHIYKTSKKKMNIYMLFYKYTKYMQRDHSNNL